MVDFRVTNEHVNAARSLAQVFLWNVFAGQTMMKISWVFLQGKLDALCVFLRKGYDRVSVMRPHPGDKVKHLFNRSLSLRLTLKMLI